MQRIPKQINMMVMIGMTEKRFTLTKGFDEHERQIRDNGKIIMGCFHEVQAKPIVVLLNELNDENEQLKSKNRGLQSELGIFKEDVTHSNLQINKLAEENEQLKQQLMDVDKLIDDKIREYQKYDEYDTEKFYIGTQLLKELKKELKGDVE